MNKVGLVIALSVFSSCSFTKIYQTEGIDQVPLAEYRSRLEAAPNPILIDVRFPSEYKKAHLDGAENVSFLFGRFKSRVSAFDRNRMVFIYCETAHRSPFAAKTLHKLGFTSITDLKGGYSVVR